MKQFAVYQSYVPNFGLSPKAEGPYRPIIVAPSKINQCATCAGPLLNIFSAWSNHHG